MIAQSDHELDSSERISREDLESLYAQLVRLPGHDEQKARQLSVLGRIYHALYQKESDAADLEKAISLHEDALQCTEPFYPQLAEDAQRLALTLMGRFQQSGDIVDIERVIEYFQNALNFTKDFDMKKPDRLSNLGCAFQLRFGHLGDLSDVQNAILLNQRAVDTMADGDPDGPARLSNLGCALESRFNRLGGLKDLGDAISNMRRAVELTPDGDPYKPARLSNLGAALQSRFERLGGLEDLEDAISNQRRAVKLTSDDHPNKPSLLNNLGTALEFRFRRLGDIEDLEGAISNHRRAVELAPHGHPDKPGWFGNLGNVLLSRFSCLGSLEDLEDAILNNRRAVELMPDRHPDLPIRLFNLGLAFVDRWRHYNILGDLTGALFAFAIAANSSFGSAMSRFKAARSWAKYSEEAHISPLGAYSCAINLLSRVAWLGLAVSDQHALLANVGAIVRDAVAAAIRYEDYETAVVWAEQGRSIVWQNLLGLRTPVDKLRQTHSEMADRLQHIARLLEGSGSRDVNLAEVPTASTGDASTNYSKLAIEWDDLIDEIRQIPGFEGFLRAKSFHQLSPAAHEGPVVILNINDSRCDALILIAEDSAERHVSAINIPLERFSHEKGKGLFRNLTELLSSAGARERNDRKSRTALSRVESDAKFKVILRILWKDVVKPVIEGLAFQACLFTWSLLPANAVISDPIRETSPHLVVRDRGARIPADSRRWRLRYTRKRGESHGLCRLLLCPDIKLHTRIVRASHARRVTSFNGCSSISTGCSADSQDRR
jgi:tetratricopeptide (TPR) repeat protein